MDTAPAIAALERAIKLTDYLDRAGDLAAVAAFADAPEPVTAADLRTEFYDALAKLRGNGRLTHNAATPFKKLEAFVVKAGTAGKAAEILGVSPGFLSQMRNSTRPIPARVLGQLGLVRAPRGREQYLEL